MTILIISIIWLLFGAFNLHKIYQSSQGADMLESLLTTFQKMDEQQKKELISRFINVMSADEKAYGALFYTLEQQEKRIREKEFFLHLFFSLLS